MTRPPPLTSIISGRRQETSPPHLQDLPEELLQLLFSHLDTAALKNVALVSKKCNASAITILWQDVRLIDSHSDTMVEGYRDPHDDTPIFQKLYILAKNPDIASRVRILTHRCRLPMPWIYDVLPSIHFDAPTLSSDTRLLNLLRLAIRNLRNVHTLRIIFGHWGLTRTLLEGFLDPNRPYTAPIRKLWLESCSLDDALIDFGPKKWITPQCGLESIRIRRLRSEGRSGHTANEFWLARGGNRRKLHDGHGGFYITEVELGEEPGGEPIPTLTGSPRLSATEIAVTADIFDDLVWDDLPHVQDFLINAPNPLQLQTPGTAPDRPILELFRMSQATLTRLNLDWILWRGGWDDIEESNEEGTFVHLRQLAKMRFPNLYHFHLRNAVVKETKLPGGVYLLESDFLEFMEAHRNIRSLAWPLDRFYSHVRPDMEMQTRVRRLVSHLGTVLVELRLDASYDGSAEQLTDRSTIKSEEQERIRRRLFIAEFAPLMIKIEQVKIEGGIPRDERREIVRALHYCPLKKVVMIGASFPIGNTWGANGKGLNHIAPQEVDTDQLELEEEDGPAARTVYNFIPQVEADFVFTPTYGWHGQLPLLYTLAAHHGSTITELKICGYIGAPILSNSTPITKPLLYPLRFFPHLCNLIISFWLLTRYDGLRRDVQIIRSWMSTRVNGMALPVYPPPRSKHPLHNVAPTIVRFPQSIPTPSIQSHLPIIPRPQYFDRWKVVYKTTFSPAALANQVAKDIGPHLASVAKARDGGVNVRASFWLGDDGRKDIFDLDVGLREGVAGDEVGKFLGPREDGERGRWWEKLERRGWF